MIGSLSATRQAEKRPEFARLLWMLPEECQPVVAMRFGGEMSISEIAGRTGQAAGDVREILLRSIDLLRQRLKPTYQTASGGGFPCTSTSSRSRGAGRFT